MALGAFIDLAEAEVAELVMPIAASAWSSGPVEDTAYTYMTERIYEAVAGGAFAPYPPSSTLRRSAMHSSPK